MGFSRRYKAPKVATVIGQGTEIKGDIVFRGGLHLDGRILGNVHGEPDSGSSVTVSDQGYIEGDIRVDSLILNGTIVGDVHGTEQVDLAAAARVTGTVYYQTLTMAPGAEVNGQLVHTDESSALTDQKADITPE
ncbi:MAG: polymer-forming cytoskeletal protein [Pseudomonadota bacterium]